MFVVPVLPQPTEPLSSAQDLERLGAGTITQRQDLPGSLWPWRVPEPSLDETLTAGPASSRAHRGTSRALGQPQSSQVSTLAMACRHPHWAQRQLSGTAGAVVSSGGMSPGTSGAMPGTGAR